MMSLYAPECRCDSCGKSEGNKSMLRCSKCKCVYYCNLKCQKDHWKHHKGFCVELSSSLQLASPMSQEDFSIEYIIEYIQSNELPSLSGVFQDKCKEGSANSFCFRCFNFIKEDVDLDIQKVRLVTISKDLIVLKGLLCKLKHLKSVSRVQESICLEDLKLNLVSKICTQIELFHESYNFIHPGGVYMKSELLYVLCKYEEAIQNYDNLPAENTFDYPKCAFMRIQMHKAKCFMELGKYIDAMKCFVKAISFMEPGETEKIDVLIGSSRCFYELCQYDKAIETGIGAVTLNRHACGAYAYIIKSYERLGNLDMCIAWTKQALYYESPWDNKNYCRLKLILSEFVKKRDFVNSV